MTTAAAAIDLTGTNFITVVVVAVIAVLALLVAFDPPDADGNTRELREVELHEVSVVQSWPAYPQTTVSLRNRPPQMLVYNLAARDWLEVSG